MAERGELSLHGAGRGPEVVRRGPQKKAGAPKGASAFPTRRLESRYFFRFAAFFFFPAFFLAAFFFLAGFFFLAAFFFFGAAFRAGLFFAPAAFFVAGLRAFFFFFGAAFFFFADFFFLVATRIPPSAEGATKFSECDRIYLAALGSSAQ